jgi:hypothetical protein
LANKGRVPEEGGDLALGARAPEAAERRLRHPVTIHHARKLVSSTADVVVLSGLRRVLPYISTIYKPPRPCFPKASQHEIHLILTTVNSSLKAVNILDNYNRKITPQILKLRSFPLHFSSKIGDNQ